MLYMVDDQDRVHNPSGLRVHVRTFSIYTRRVRGPSPGFGRVPSDRTQRTFRFFCRTRSTRTERTLPSPCSSTAATSADSRYTLL